MICFNNVNSGAGLSFMVHEVLLKILSGVESRLDIVHEKSLIIAIRTQSLKDRFPT